MKLPSFPFQTFDWPSIPKEEHKGETGVAYWQIQMMNDIRVRMVEYTPGYKADHWCQKGHVIYCMEGELDIILDNGNEMKLIKDMSLLIGDENEAHFISTAVGCKLFIVD